MDRLICGDVGFGKTEVAMRAAFIAVQNRKQVAILVPTTLLAQQHHESFRDRFADWPVQIEAISRLRTESEIEAVRQRLSAGAIDIVIGTHKLLNTAFSFKELGLVIIDEEHRFGVRQKERLRTLRAEVDVLTLTATPIPRTLNLAMGGIRDMSIIATPPARRLSVKTFVVQRRKHLIREAITRELARGGQVFYLHNEVRTIEQTATRDRRAGAGSAHRRRPRPDAEAPPRSGDGRLLSPPQQRAGVHHHHRNRHRHSEREHHDHGARRQVRPGATAPAARPRRPIAPAGLCLSVDSASEGADRRRAQTPRSNRSGRRTRRRFHARDPRSGDSRRRRTVGRGTVRADRIDRLLAVHGHARSRSARNSRRQNAGPRRRSDAAPGGQSARAGADSGGLSAGRALAADSVQAHQQRRKPRRARRTARRDHRPLRRVAGRDEDAVQDHRTALDRGVARHRANRLRADRRPDRIRRRYARRSVRAGASGATRAEQLSARRRNASARHREARRHRGALRARDASCSNASNLRRKPGWLHRHECAVQDRVRLRWVVGCGRVRCGRAGCCRTTRGIASK